MKRPIVLIGQRDFAERLVRVLAGSGGGLRLVPSLPRQLLLSRSYSFVLPHAPHRKTAVKRSKTSSQQQPQKNWRTIHLAVSHHVEINALTGFVSPFQGFYLPCRPGTQCVAIGWYVSPLQGYASRRSPHIKHRLQKIAGRPLGRNLPGHRKGHDGK